MVNMNKGGGGSDSDDDDMAFGESPSSTPPGMVGKGFHKIAVKRDQSTGDITGWQDFYAMARADNPDLI